MTNNGITPISEILSGTTNINLKVRVIHQWSIPDHTNPAENGNLHMILLDEKCGKIHAVVRKNLIPHFKEKIVEGSIYVFEKFLVSLNDVSFRTTNHKYKLSLMGTTNIFKVDAPEIPLQHFEFMSFTNILSSAKEDKLLDIIGHVVEKDDIKEIEKNGKKNKVLDIKLEDLESLDTIDFEDGNASTTKHPKLPSLKFKESE